MKIITTVSGMKEYSRKARAEGRTIGFVPTMGYLHEGHMSLVDSSKEECDVTVLSVYVNPTQFLPGEDLEKYPRDLERDKAMARERGVDAMFVPSDGQMYPGGYSTFVEVTGTVAEKLCGRARPGHFRGVATAVTKLFNIVAPDRSYFGQKDFQQAVIIRRMAKDLDMDIEVMIRPTVREKDGLAMSSRNSYLEPRERKEALNIYLSLQKARELAISGESSAARIKEEMTRIVTAGAGIRLDYIEIMDTESLLPVENVKKGNVAAVAAFVGRVRLIDNMLLG